MFDYAASGLAAHEISLEDIIHAYETLLGMDFITVSDQLGITEIAALARSICGRSQRVWLQGNTAASDVRAAGVSKTGSILAAASSSSARTQTERPRLLRSQVALLCEMSDPEAMAGAAILNDKIAPSFDGSIFCQAAAPVTHAAVWEYLAAPQSEKGCRTLIILLSNATKHSVESISLIILGMQRYNKGDLSIISISMDDFSFPNDQYFSEHLVQLLSGPPVGFDAWLPTAEAVQLMRQFFRLIAMPLSTHASDREISAQAAEAMRRSAATPHGPRVLLEEAQAALYTVSV